MKNQLYILLFILTSIFYSCEDVIDVDVPNSTPKLVIEASINWFNDTQGNEQEIKLSLTADYFNNEVPPANNATVSITDEDNNTFVFTEEGNSGVYKTTTFIPEINKEYTLTITYDGEVYEAKETLYSVVPIDYVEQNNDGGFSGQDIELKAYYTDPADEVNNYLFEFICDIPSIPDVDVYKDEFINGNQIFSYYTEEDLTSGKVVTIRNYGISLRFYNYMNILLSQSGSNGGSPFQTQPATVRGNCINVTNPDNFPLGYFRLSQATELLYTVE